MTTVAGESIAIDAADLGDWRRTRDRVDALVERVRLLDVDLCLELEAAINALVVDVQRAWLAATLHQLGAQWEYLPDIIQVGRDLGPPSGEAGH